MAHVVGGRGAAVGLLLAACGGGEGHGPGTTGDGPTYHRDVAPILADSCGGCHREGGLGSRYFSVETYPEASAWADAIVDAVESGRMPPYSADTEGDCAPPLPLADDPRPTADERAVLRAWAEAGAPEGDPADASPLALGHPPIEANREYTLATPFEVGGTEDIYWCFRIPLGLGAEEYVDGIEIVPDNDLVVHHVLVWNDPHDLSAGMAGADGSYACDGEPGFFPTELLGSWAPGTPAFEAPAGAATPLKAGSSLVLNIHYYPTGTSTERDQTKIRLRTSATKPSKYFTMYLLDLPFGAVSEPGPGDRGGPEFRIPAGVADHTETVALEIPTLVPWPLEIFQVGPHMHYLGTDMKVWIDRDGQEECLLHDPGYRFDFQNTYPYDGSAGPWPVAVAGDVLKARCTYDNSPSNPYLPLHLAASGGDAPHDVGWGEQTGDEMCMARVGILLPPVDWMELLSSLY